MFHCRTKSHKKVTSNDSKNVKNMHMFKQSLIIGSVVFIGIYAIIEIRNGEDFSDR